MTLVMDESVEVLDPELAGAPRVPTYYREVCRLRRVDRRTYMDLYDEDLFELKTNRSYASVNVWTTVRGVKVMSWVTIWMLDTDNNGKPDRMVAIRSRAEHCGNERLHDDVLGDSEVIATATALLDHLFGTPCLELLARLEAEGRYLEPIVPGRKLLTARA